MPIAQEQALTDVLVEGGAEFELLPHRHTETARAEARALGLELDEVAKTVVVRTPDGYVRVVVPASERVDLGKLRALLGTEGVEGVIRLATESELAAAYPGFDLGAVPPLGGPAGDTVVLDLSLTRHVRLVFEAGTHEESVRLRTDDLVNLTHATIGDVCEA
ncbi:MAG TPA: YbaK/EbsC family protein [Gaiellaceae bacterium]|jgi:Ala-tRNA(Pro) deacylase|nr:YbaK/EbsC family protein [Gaiellaceae bacterium]